MYYKDKNFGFFDYQQLTKDLCHYKPLSFRYRTRNPHTLFQFSEVVQVRSDKSIFTDNTKIIHDFSPNHRIVTNFAINNMRLYYGYKLPQQIPHSQQSTIIYSRLRSDRKLQNASFTVGAQRNTPHVQLQTNMSMFLFDRKNDYFLYGKLLLLNKYFNLGLLSILDCGSRNLQTNNLVVQLKPHEKHQIFLRGEVDGLRNYSMKYNKIGNYFDYFITNYIFRPTSTLSLMAELKYDINSGKMKNIQSIIEKKFGRHKVKLGLNQCADIILQFQFPLRIGRHSNIDLGIELSDVLKSRKISYGFQLNLDI